MTFDDLGDGHGCAWRYLARIRSGLTVDAAARSYREDVLTRPYLRVANVQMGTSIP